MDVFRKNLNFRIIFLNFRSNESEIRNKKYKICGGTIKPPNAKNRNVLPTKLRPVDIFQKIKKKNSK